MDKLIVIGAGGHSKVIQDIVNTSEKYCIHAVLDDAFLTTKKEKEIIFSDINYINNIDIKKYYFVIAIGANEIRRKIVEKILIPTEQYATIIHPSAIVSKSSKINKGTVVMPHAVVNANTIVGKHNIINTSCVIEHDNMLGDFVHISPGTVLSGGVSVNNYSHLGSGSVVIPGIKIGSSCIVGAGTVVTKDLPNNVTAVGVPAKIIKE